MDRWTNHTSRFVLATSWAEPHQVNVPKHVSTTFYGTVRIRRFIPLLPQTPPPNLMSSTPSAASSSSSFHSIFNNALVAYEKRTKKNILFHPLAEKLQTCNSPDAILLVLQQQVQEINRPRSGDEILTKWLDPTVRVLYTFNEALGEGVGLVCFKTCF